MPLQYNTDLTTKIREELKLSRIKFINEAELDITERQLWSIEKGRTLTPSINFMGQLYDFYVKREYATFPLFKNELGNIISIPINNAEIQ